MNKELETLEKLISFAFVMSENMVGLTKGNYDENQFIKKTYEYLHKYNVDLNSKLELKKSLQRLESIDNANPSEALEYIENKLKDLEYVAKQNDNEYLLSKYIPSEKFATIKQALIKAQENTRSEEILQKYYQEGITLDSVRELKKENEILKEILKSFFDRGRPLHQYTDKDGMLLIEVDNECSTMHLGKFKGVDLDAKLKEVLE